MKRTIRQAICNLTLASALSATAVSAKEVTIALDVSGSNPLLNDKAFNQRAINYVLKNTSELEDGDTLTIETFGSLNNAENFTSITQKISRHNLKKVQRLAKSKISTLTSTVEVQSSTNLLAYLSRRTASCESGDELIVITDGIEASEYISPDALLSGKQSLPAPNEFVKLEGCEVQFFGIGVGRSDTEMLTLKREWQRYFSEAKAKFKGIAL